MATFAAATQYGQEWEEGRIMVTQGLSKSEMNGQIVELESQKNVGTENLRWNCLFLEKQERNSIKPANLTQPATPTAQETEIVKQLVEEHNKLCSVNEWALAQEKILLALSNIPHSGLLHQLLGDLSHRMGLDTALTTTHMRRSVANSDGSTADTTRLFQARINYSGLLGNLGDLKNEQAQLDKLLQIPEPPADCCKLIPTIMILYADSLRSAQKFEESLAILRQLESMPRPLPKSVNVRFDVEKELERNLAQLSMALYQLALALEKRAEETGGLTKMDKKALLEQVKALLTRSIDVMNDAAALAAYERVCRKLNPSEPVIINGLLISKEGDNVRAERVDVSPRPIAVHMGHSGASHDHSHDHSCASHDHAAHDHSHDHSQCGGHH